MYEDEPQDRVHDVLGEAVFGDHPLGRRILGQSNVIASIPIPDLSEYHRLALHGSRTSSSAPPGTSSTPTSSSSPERHVSPPAKTAPQHDGARPPARPRFGFYAKETEQYHICFGAPGISRGDERRFQLALLDAIFGGSTSSRLFREIREKRGLAYSVGSYTEAYVELRDGRDVRRHPRGQRRRGVPDHRHGARQAALRGRHRRGARARQGARQGPHGAGPRVDRGAHVPDLALDPLRRARAVARRDARARGGGHTRRSRRARHRVLRPGGPLGGRDRAERGPLPHRPSERQRRAGPQRHDSRRGLGRGGEDGQRPSARRSRAPTTWSWPAAPTPSSTRRSADVLDGADVVVDFTTPGHGRGQRARGPGGGTSRASSARPASTSTSCAPPPRTRRRRRALLRGPELRDRRRADDAVRAPGAPSTCPSARSSSSITTPSWTRHREPRSARPAHRATPAATSTSRSTRSASRAWSRTRRSSSAAGGDADDPPRLDGPPLVHARRAARRAQGRRAAEPAHGRAREASLS